MIAIDTNVLVYAHREDSAHHARALALLQELTSSEVPWAVPMQCLVEFVGIVTHPRIYAPPTPLAIALDTIDKLVAVPTIRVLSESANDWPVLSKAFRKARVRGPRVHDARIAAVCRDNGVSEILTADRRFPPLPGLRARSILD